MLEPLSSYRFDHTFLSLVTFDNEILKELISEVLNVKIKQAKIINSKMAKRRLIERANYLDLVVETEIGYVNIEVSNNSYNKYSAHRNFIYLTTLISNVTKVGMKLEEMPKVYQINLIYGSSNKIDISRYNMYSKEENRLLTRKFEIFNIYMDKLKEMYYNNNKKLTDKLLLLGLTMTREELNKNRKENIMFEKLLKKLDEMEDKGLAPELMPVSEENEWHNKMLIRSAKEEGIEQGITKGIAENRISVVSNMLKKKFDFKTISEITGLSSKQIRKIANK